jgi:hypothetical protein
LACAIVLRLPPLCLPLIDLALEFLEAVFPLDLTMNALYQRLQELLLNQSRPRGTHSSHAGGRVGVAGGKPRRAKKSVGEVIGSFLQAPVT